MRVSAGSCEGPLSARRASSELKRDRIGGFPLILGHEMNVPLGGLLVQMPDESGEDHALKQ
jgi:hypothetical protein